MLVLLKVGSQKLGELIYKNTYLNLYNVILEFWQPCFLFHWDFQLLLQILKLVRMDDLIFDLYDLDFNVFLNIFNFSFLVYWEINLLLQMTSFRRMDDLVFQLICLEIFFLIYFVIFLDLFFRNYNLVIVITLRRIWVYLNKTFRNLFIFNIFWGRFVFLLRNKTPAKDKNNQLR